MPNDLINPRETLNKLEVIFDEPFPYECDDELYEEIKRSGNINLEELISLIEDDTNK